MYKDSEELFRVKTKSRQIYARFIKRIIDFVLAFCAVIIFLPLLVILVIVGTIIMKGNPFFIQERPGRNEKVFKLIKLRTMTYARDGSGQLLPDEKRLVKYGLFLRKTSLDELPEIFNILIGQMAIVGPRPLLVKYLPRYNAEQRRRHELRPGLTGYAQIHGRNAITWEQKFKMDVWYVDHISFKTDVGIFFGTIKAVLKREGISSESSATMEEFMGTEKNL